MEQDPSNFLNVDQHDSQGTVILISPTTVAKETDSRVSMAPFEMASENKLGRTDSF